MPRATRGGPKVDYRDTKGTPKTASPRDTRGTQYLPARTGDICRLFDYFVEKLDIDNNEGTSLDELYSEYIAMLTTENFKDVAKSKERLGRNLTKCRKEGLRKYRQDGVTFYNVRVRRVRQKDGTTTRTLTNELLVNYLEMTKDDKTRKGLVDKQMFRTNIGPPKNFAAIAKKTLFKNEILCEYRGTLIPEDEATARDDFYIAQGLPAAIYVINRTEALDPYRVAGTDIDSVQNPGVWINHAAQPNCKVCAVRNKKAELLGLVMVATKTVSMGEELLQDYNDKNALESWLN